MLLALGIVAAVGVGAWALARPRPPSSSSTATPGAKPIGSTTPPPEKPVVTVALAPPGGGSKEALGFVTTGLGVVGTAVGIVKGAAGVLGGTGGATAGAAAGVSLSLVAGWGVAIAAIAGFVIFSIMFAANDFEQLKTGPAGYMQINLVRFGNETAQKHIPMLMKPVADGGRGYSELKARAMARLIGFACAVGYNRAAWAWVKHGGVPRVQNLQLREPTEPEFEGYYVARAFGLPDEIGYIYESKAPPPPKPPNHTGAWPPPPPLIGSLAWGQTLEWFMFQGHGTTRAQCLADAGSEWNAELEGVCDFIGRASRCAYMLHNKMGQGGIAIFSTESAVRAYASTGAIGMPQLSTVTGVRSNPTAHPQWAENTVIDSAKQCVKGGVFGGPAIAWFFSESIEHGVVPVRGY